MSDFVLTRFWKQLLSFKQCIRLISMILLLNCQITKLPGKSTAGTQSHGGFVWCQIIFRIAMSGDFELRVFIC